MDAKAACEWAPDARYGSVRAALLASASTGREDATVAPEEAAEFRRYGLIVLRDALAADEKTRVGCRYERNLRRIRADPDLESVRDPDALNKLGEAERKAWQAFWADVEERLAALK